MKKSAAIFVLLVGSAILAGGTMCRLSENKDSDSIPASAYLQIGTPYAFQDDSTTVVTVPVTKTDPYVSAGGTSVLFTARSQHNYGYVPYLNFGQDTVYVTCRFYDAENTPVTAVFDPEDDEISWVDYLEEYDYLDENADNETLLALYENQWHNRPEFTVKEDSDSRVDFTIATASGEKDYLSGTVQICFMNGDTCVFADSVDYECPHEKDSQFEMTYRIPYQLPAYTDIQFIDLY